MKFDRAERLMRNNRNELNVIEVEIDGITSFVPENDENRHYSELQRQKREGKIQITERNIGG